MKGLSQTLRFRLTVWYAVVLSLVLAFFGALIYGLVRYQLMRHHDADLIEAAASVSRILSDDEGVEGLTEMQRDELTLSGNPLVVHVRGRADELLFQSPMAEPFLGAIEQDGPADALGGWFHTVPEQGGPLRIYSLPFRSPGGRELVIHVAHSLGDVPAPLASLRFSLLLMAPLAVMLSAAGGYWLAGRALAPVDEVTRAAREIEASRLSRRLPAPKVYDEIGRLVETFNQMIARLEASFEAMKRFTADASHELRSPLATMRGAIDVALSRPREAGDYRDVLSSVGEDVDRLRSIAEDLLMLARADAGGIKLERSPVRLDVIASEVTESFRPTAEEKSVEVSAACPTAVVVSGDERWLRQLVVNLLDNAVKFSAAARPEPGAASVRVEVREDHGRAELSVTDSGPGVPDEALDRIFERFFRADDARSHQGAEGSGLGLAIAAWIVGAHAGKIAARNQAAGGSVFSVSLPLAR